MIPDYSIELCFADEYRPQVQLRLASLCDLESATIVRNHPFGDEKFNAEICLMAPSDAPQEMLDGFRIEDEVACCGIIDLEYAPNCIYANFAGSFGLEIWPRSRRLQYISFASMEFRSEVTGILAECGGTWGAIVFESSFSIEFWSREKGRYNDNFPERRDGKLLLPSELTSSGGR